MDRSMSCCAVPKWAISASNSVAPCVSVQALPKDVSEMIIIMTGRFWMAQYEWNAHKDAALQNGVNPAIVDAIAPGKRPTGMSPRWKWRTTSSTSCSPLTR